MSKTDTILVRSRLEWLGILIAMLIPLWLPGAIPTYDGPQHTFAGFLINHLHDVTRGYDRYLGLQIPRSCLFYPLLVAGFERLSSIRIAVKLSLSVVFLVQSLGFLQLLRVTQDRGSPWRWLAAMFPYNLLYYMGFHNFSLAVGIAAWTLSGQIGIAKRTSQGQRVGWLSWLMVGAGLLLAALSHAFVAALLGLILGLAILGSSPLRRAAGLLARLFAVSIPTLAHLAWVGQSALLHQRTSLASQLGFNGAGVTSLPLDLFANPYLVVWTANLVAALALLIMLLSALGGNRTARGLGLASAGLILVLLVVPDHIDAWKSIHSRFPALLCLLAGGGAVIPRASFPSLRKMMSGVILTGVLVSLVLTALTNIKLAGVQAEFESGIGHGAPRAIRHVFFHPGPPEGGREDIYVTANLPLYYAMNEGGLFPYLFADRPESHYPVRLSTWSEMLPEDVPDMQPLPLQIRWQVEARLGLRYEDVLLWDPPEGYLTLFERQGYRPIFTHDRLHRLVPPHRALRLLVRAPQGSNLLAKVVFGDLLWPFVQGGLQPLADDPRTYTAAIHHLPAAVVYVSLFEPSGQGDWTLLRTEAVDLRGANALIEIDLRDGPNELDFEPPPQSP